MAWLLTCFYHLFPNVLVIVFSHQMNVVVLEPVTVDRTRASTYSFTNRGLSDPEARKAAERDAEFVRDAGLAEDRAVVCDIQRSLGSRANEVFTFGLFRRSDLQAPGPSRPRKGVNGRFGITGPLITAFSPGRRNEPETYKPVATTAARSLRSQSQ